MRFLVKLSGFVKFAAPAMALIVAAGAGAADSLKDSGEIRPPHAIELYKSISRNLAAEHQREPRGLQILAAPDNDNFDDAIALEGQSGRVTGDTFDATREPGEPDHAFTDSASSVWYTFTPDRAGVTIIDTFGSDFDTVLAVYSGNRVDDLVEVASNDDAGGTLQSQVAFLAEAGTTYRIAVDGFGGAEGAFTLNFERTDRLAPTNDDFDDATALDGRRGSVTGDNAGATVEPGEPMHARRGGVSSVWYSFTPSRNGVTTLDVSGSGFDPVLAVYTGDSVNALDEVASGFGSLAFFAEESVTYRIAVDAEADSFFGSGEGTFTLNFRRTNQKPSPNDDFEDAIALEGRRGSIAGNNVGATRQRGEPRHAGRGGGSSVWYSFAPSRSGVTSLEAFDQSFSFFQVLAVYTGNSVNALAEVAASGRFGPLDFFAEEGVTYRIAVDADLEFTGEGTFVLDFRRTNRTPPVNDDFEDAMALEGRRGTVRGTTVGATRQGLEPPHFFGGGTRSIWYTFTPSRTGVAIIDTFGSECDTVLAVYTGDDVTSLEEVAANDDTTSVDDDFQSFGVRSQVAFVAERGTEYHIAVDDSFTFVRDAGEVTLNYRQTSRRTPANDAFADARELSGESDIDSGFNVNASAQPGEPPHAGMPASRSVWWRWQAPFTGDVTFTTAGSNFDTVLAVYQGGTVSGLIPVAGANNDDAELPDDTIPQSLVTFEAQEGEAYYIAVDGVPESFPGDLEDEGSITLTFRRGEAGVKTGSPVDKERPRCS